MSSDSDELMRRLANHSGVSLHLCPHVALSICSLLQLALKHPAIPQDAKVRAAGDILVRSLVAELSRGDAFVRELLERGNGSRQKVGPTHPGLWGHSYN